MPDHSTDYVTNPPVCGRPASSAATSSPSVWVSDTGDGTVFAVPHDSTVGITYLYGRPVFSPGVPLCALPLGDGAEWSSIDPRRREQATSTSPSRTEPWSRESR